MTSTSLISRRICNKTIAFSGLVLLTGVTAFAQCHGDRPPTASSSASSNVFTLDSQASLVHDEAFVRRAMEGGMAEVQLGQMAAEKASNDDVKQLGQTMVADYTQLGEQMKQVAEHLRVKPPAGVSKKDKELMAKLQSLSGAEFDNAYIVAVVKDHKKDAENDYSHDSER